MMQNTKVNVAVAGLGRMGKRYVQTLINRVPLPIIVAACSSSPVN
jgi:hypothetical protein